jgi:hypothetical protein
MHLGRQFWQELKEATSTKLPILHHLSWATDHLEGKVASTEDASMILCDCWSIWIERNAVWHGDKGPSIIESVQWTLATTTFLGVAKTS